MLRWVLTYYDNKDGCLDFPEDPSANRPCYSFQGLLSVLYGNKEYPDILVIKTGTETDVHGNKTSAENDFYVFNGKEYEQAYNIDSTTVTLSSQYVQNMLDGSLNGDEKKILAAKSLLEKQPKPPKGDKKSARKLNEQGLKFISSQEYNRAELLFEKASQLDPSDIEILNNYGYALMKSNQLVYAESFLTTALTIQPDRVTAWANYADTLTLSGKKELAVAAYLNALRFSKDRVKTVKYFNKQLDEEKNQTVLSTITKALSKSKQRFDRK